MPERGSKISGAKARADLSIANLADFPVADVSGLARDVGLDRVKIEACQ
jgi:hypothetical protein